MKNLILVSLLFLSSCTPKPETKISEVLQKEFSKSEGVAEYAKGLDQLYGKDPSKFKTSMVDFFNNRIDFKFTDIKAEGETASAVVTATLPNRKDVEGIVGITIFMDRKVLNEMTLDELINKLGKESKAPITSSRDIKDETIKETVELRKEGQDEWKLEPDSKKKVAAAITKSKGK